MMDQFLTHLLQIVIVLDILGALAYFLLGALRRAKRAEGEQPQTVPLHSDSSLWRELWLKVRPRRRLTAVPAQDMERLRSVLNSFEEGLH